MKQAAERIPGDYIPATACAEEKYSDRPAVYASNGSGMSGCGSADHTHSGELDAMWLSSRDPGEHCAITFDLHCVRQIGLCAVWNFNQPGATGAGMRDVIVEYSAKGDVWVELKSKGWPFRLAKADGRPGQHATNLDDGRHSPIDFCGASARYVRFRPRDVRPGCGGNWGEYVEGQHRFGLAQVRFFSYRPPVCAGGYIPAVTVGADLDPRLSNLTNGYGLNSADRSDALHGCDPDSMWLSDSVPQDRCLTFDLLGTYPLSSMCIWNYNEPFETSAGLKNVYISTSIDGTLWTRLETEDQKPFVIAKAGGAESEPASGLNDGKHTPIGLKGVRARYVRIEAAGGMGVGTWGPYHLCEDRFGLSKVRFYAAEGYCVEPCCALSSKLSNYDGWGGADGIYTVPLDGTECKPKPDEKIRDTLVIFSDTFVGKADPVTHRRKKYTLINNSAAYLTENESGDLCFDYRFNTDVFGTPVSLITRGGTGKNDTEFYKGLFYWLQDCAVLNGKLYVFTANVTFDAGGSEGFRFKLLGVDRVKLGIKDGEVDFAHPAAEPTHLFAEDGDIVFGSAILPNGYKSKLPFADGYVYVYGVCSRAKPFKQLIVARVQEDRFDDLSAFEFYDGEHFVPDISRTAPICDETSSEMSVTPIESGPYAGKYLLVYTVFGISDIIACRIGDTPCGPFGKQIPLYRTDEPRRMAVLGGERMYTYNAKAHYHISSQGELLISYNMNTVDFESHIKNAEIYHPRFIRIRRL